MFECSSVRMFEVGGADEAAGLAAAMSVATGCTPRRIDVTKLRAELVSRGACLA